MNCERLLLACVASAFVVAAAHAEDIERELNLRAGGAVQISNVAGTTQVETWDGDTVRIKASLGEDCLGLETRSDGALAVVEVQLPRGKGGEKIRADLHVAIPREMQVRVESVSADVEARHTGGDLTIQSASGDVLATFEGVRLSIESVSGDVRVNGRADKLEVRTAGGDVTAEMNTPNLDIESISGDVTLKGEQGRVRVATTSGDVRQEGSVRQAHVETISGDMTLKSVTESADVSTTSADISVHGENLGELQAQSISGDIEFAGSLNPTGVVNIASKAGEVRLKIPENTPARFDLRSFSGDIQVANGPDTSNERGPGKRLAFEQAAATASLDAETFSGDIRIEYAGASPGVE